MKNNTLKVAIWSDIRCPFCYIGKRKFEMALEKFEHKDNIEIEWYSFELDPGMITQLGKNVYDYLAERKGASREWSEKMHEQVAATAAEVGLKYNFDIAVVANSFDAHRLIQYAKTKGFGDLAEEVLFKAYFTEGANISDKNTLLKLGVLIGLNSDEITAVIHSDDFAYEVKQDVQMANNIGVGGVPFFVLNQKYAVSGAQDPEVFLQALEQTWKETIEEENITSAS